MLITSLDLGMSSIWAFLLGVVMPLAITLAVYDRHTKKRPR